MKKEKIPYSIPYIDDREIEEVSKVLRGKWITTGSEVKKFEAQVKKYLGVETAVAVSSGTAALEISLAVSGVGDGDEVLTTAYTFASTALAIIHRGAVPVLVDIEPDTFNIDPGKIAEKIAQEYELTESGLQSKKTKRLLKGIIPVHFGGQPVEMEAIREIARKNRLFIIEDAAHAIGAVHKGEKIGKSPNPVCFSFYANKNITTGEGGMIAADCNCREWEKKLRMFSLHGLSKDITEREKTGLPFYDIIYPGLKANLTDIQAALGVVQIKKLPGIVRMRNRVAAWYDEFLAGVDGVTTPVIREYNLSARHLYPVLLNPKLKYHRDEIIVELRKKGICPSVHFIPVHFHSFFKKFFKEEIKLEEIKLPISEDLFSREISLPIFPGLKRNEVKYVADTLKRIIHIKRTKSR
ncbi:MAG TPA: DegT/DnrJ/EryC1/StrS family aminotransferase [Candidatus Deferrimicrobium sp.]|nr:DegT/DnrJ/EryC1/StrS family aminotransferase [Candidatus Deferrimicrobium sp.]